uniref:Ig-like domain-containing protein n=1 Tax=Salvator merianae TaxID=96440 RepID=A0A8D0BSW6_SALMN
HCHCCLGWSAWCLCGCSSAGISQTYSLVHQEGQNAQLECRQTNNHDSMFWYRQEADQSLQLLYSFLYLEVRENSSISSRFTAERPQTAYSNLKISSVKQEDSAVYFCATSKHSTSK